MIGDTRDADTAPDSLPEVLSHELVPGSDSEESAEEGSDRSAEEDGTGAEATEDVLTSPF